MKRTAVFAILLGGLGLSACKEGSSDSPGGTGGGAGDGDGDGDGTGGQGDGGDSGSGGTTADYPTPDCPTPADLGVRIVGRHDGCTEGAVRLSWSGTGFIARFEGTGLSFTQIGNSVQYTVLVDGELGENIVTDAGEGTYFAATGLAAGQHTVEVYRRGEASFGPSTLTAVEVTDGELLEPPAHPERRIEAFGDSITCGYGNEGLDMSCPFSADTENHYQTYAAILARSFDAELSTVAWSGKGVVSNYGGNMITPFPDLLDRAVGTVSTSVWDYSLAPEPDLVLVNLGTNDFSTDSDPEAELFASTYEEMLRTIRERYPTAYLLCTVGPLLGGTDLTNARAGIEAAVTALHDSGDTRAQAFQMTTGNPSPGCDWHPSIATHEAMAAELTPVVEEALGW